MNFDECFDGTLVAMLSNDANCCIWFENSPNLEISQRLNRNGKDSPRFSPNVSSSYAFFVQHHIILLLLSMEVSSPRRDLTY